MEKVYINKINYDRLKISNKRLKEENKDLKDELKFVYAAIRDYNSMCSIRLIDRDKALKYIYDMYSFYEGNKDCILVVRKFERFVRYSHSFVMCNLHHRMYLLVKQILDDKESYDFTYDELRRCFYEKNKGFYVKFRASDRED